MPSPPFEYSQYEDGRHVNYWALTPALQREARRLYPADEFDWAEDRLADFGRVVGETIAENADLIDDHGPVLRTFDKHGELWNDVQYHPAQAENEALIYERGIVADAFRPPPGRDEPLGLAHTLVLQLLLAYADTGLVCSQSMTSGAALVLRNHDAAGAYDEYFDAMTARNAAEVIEGAMFLTEEQGGSDVGAVETVAEPVEGRTYELTGEKWFCSNIDAQCTLALARRPSAPAGTDGLSLFLVPHRLPDGSLNDQRYRRLKDKLGTTSVPTGEVEFDGTTGYLVGEPERGFTYMTTMLNWERVTNAVGAVGIIGRLLLESCIHAANRDAFGQPIQAFPLMQRDLVEMAVDHEATLVFAMEASQWFDRYERDHDDDRAFKLMRLLVPVAKHVTTRTAVETASYAMEIQGGNGYVADFVTHRLLRDAQALPIWEGTANILALDVLRAMEHEAAHEPLVERVRVLLDGVGHPYLESLAALVEAAFESLQAALLALASGDEATAQYEAKELAEFLYDVVTAALLLSRAQAGIDDASNARLAVVADLFVADALADRPTRGIRSDATRALEHFNAVVRYATLDPSQLPSEPTARASR